MTKTNKLRTIKCFYCHSVTLMIPSRFECKQLCIDCVKRIEDRKRLQENGFGIITELCGGILAWKNEAVKRGYKNAIRLEWERGDGKDIKEKYLIDLWTRLKLENEDLKRELESLKEKANLGSKLT